MENEKMVERIRLLGLTADLKSENGVRHFNKGHEYVEIGGVKWATMNIGAKSITDSGLYFQWGDTKGYTADEVGTCNGQKAFTWNDYKFGLLNSLSKYNSTDGKTVLESSDDAAQVAWGGSWRMPTKDEFQTLCTAVNGEWTNDYQGSGVSGMVLTDKTDSSKVLFFPAVGLCINGGVDNVVGADGYYWSSSARNGSGAAYYLDFFSCRCGVRCNYRYYRYPGFSVRAVLD